MPKAENLICIVCPRGCRLSALPVETSRAEDKNAMEKEGGTVPAGPGKKVYDYVITGNSCPRGEAYARQELTNPTRVLTALMRPLGAQKPVSVKTDRPVPKALLFACVAEIYRTHPAAPIRRGQILMENICGTGANVIATRSMTDMTGDGSVSISRRDVARGASE